MRDNFKQMRRDPAAAKIRDKFEIQKTPPLGQKHRYSVQLSTGCPRTVHVFSVGQSALSSSSSSKLSSSSSSVLLLGWTGGQAMSTHTPTRVRTHARTRMCGGVSRFCLSTCPRALNSNEIQQLVWTGKMSMDRMACPLPKTPNQFTPVSYLHKGFSHGEKVEVREANPPSQAAGI